MSKKIIKLFTISAFLVMFFSFQGVNAASLPVLNFSDLINGPKTGLNDELGEGVIVTIWGNNLGSAQGSSKVYFKDAQNNIIEAAHVYYWKNADGQLPGGPADLYASHRMQEIAFSIPTVAADGAGKIYVEIDGQSSNELEFTVRAGDIFYVKATGNDSTGNGSWANPWRTFGVGTNGASTKASVNAGDIGYGVDAREVQSVLIRVKDGTASSPIALVAYPNTILSLKNDGTVNPNSLGGLGAYNITDKPEYWIFSKWDIRVKGSSGVQPFNGGRVIGNAITDYLDGEGCADGSAGAIVSMNGLSANAKIFGNYIHDWGCYETSNQEHTTYFSIRNQGYDSAPIDFGWNSMIDNWARFGVHFYDEHSCWGYTGVTKVHDNYILNQVGPGFNLGTLGCDAGRTLSGDFDVYNNIFANTGLKGANNAGISAIHLYGKDTPGHIRIFNNTIFGYGYAGVVPSSYDAGINVDYSPGGSGYYYFAGTWELVNNIIVDTNNLEFFSVANPLLPASAANNLWFKNGSIAIPTFGSDSILTDPKFVNAVNGDFSLQTDSPAIDSGSTLTSTVLERDLFGLPRPQGIFYDIGAIEYVNENTSVVSSDLAAPIPPIGVIVN